MDLAEISMDQAAAEQAFREYRAAFMKHRNQIDGELMRGYKELAKGHKLISLAEALAAAGFNDQGLPAIAINRADEPFVLLDASNSQGGESEFYNRSPRTARHQHSLTIRTPGVSNAWGKRAVAPIIPPKYRPPFKLENYHLLWEVQRWTDNPQPRRDPALLKHIGGDLYAVLAIWDLTELESRVLGLLRQ